MAMQVCKVTFRRSFVEKFRNLIRVLIYRSLGGEQGNPGAPAGKLRSPVSTLALPLKRITAAKEKSR